MPKRNKLPNSKLVVSKSNPLLSLSESELSLLELKIFDVYLSRINSRKRDDKIVYLKNGELEKLFGVDRIRKEELDLRLYTLMHATIKVIDKRKPKGYVYLNLFSKAEVEQDDLGFWNVVLKCSEDADEYIFDIEQIGYLSYILKNVIDLKSRYSYILYLQLEKVRKDKYNTQKEWEVSLVDLKKMLNCDSETYDKFYRFNDLILKKCHKEITTKTDLMYEYEPQRSGRKIVAVKFKVINSICVKSDDTNQIALLSMACDNEFSKVQIEEIQALLNTVQPDNKELYLKHKYAKLNTRCSRTDLKPVKDRFSYLVASIENDISENTPDEQEQEHSYDLEEYKKLVNNFDFD